MKWGFFFVLFAEFLLFDRMTSSHFAQTYPRWNDQIQPLNEAYTGYEYLRTNGFCSGIWHTLTKPAAQGDLHSFWAILIFETVGRPSRSAALAVNMLAFLVWQFVLAYAVVRETGSHALAWIAIGLTLALQWPWSGIQGSATDFRLDQVAMCMMGISLASALLTDGFRRTGWSSIFGVVVGITLLTRFLTVTYFVVIFGAFLVWILFSQTRPRRLFNIALAAAVAGGIAAPCFWFNRREIYGHYWIGHYRNPDGLLWSTNLSFGHAFVRILKQLCGEQLGVVFWLGSSLAVLILAGGLWRARRGPQAEPSRFKTSWPRNAAIVASIFLFAPVLVLALQNNDRMVVVVLGVAVPGVVVLLLALCAELRTEISGRINPPSTDKIVGVAAALTFLIGGVYFVARETTLPYDSNAAADARGVNVLADRIFASARLGGITEPRVAVDRITDCLDGNVLCVICYERHQVWIPFIMELPTGIASAPETELMSSMASSDFVIATEEGPPGPWPYDQEMFALRPKILAWCNAHLRLITRITISGQRMALYERAAIPSS